MNPPVEMSETLHRPLTVFFVSTNRGLGGQSKSLMTLLEHLPDEAVAHVTAPAGR